MFLQFWAGIWSPVLAGYAGYLFTGKYLGVFGGLLSYCAVMLASAAARQLSRNDYWASRVAELHAEQLGLQAALAEEYRREVKGGSDTRALQDAYRTRLALLEVSKKAVRAGYLSYKAAGVFSHFSEKKGGLLPDGA